MPEDTHIEVKQSSSQAFVHTEGKTDWKHLQKAMQKLKLNLSLRFYDKEDCIGDRNLLDHCKSLSKGIYPQEKPLIFVFDRDNPQVVKEVNDEDKPFKHWGNNVYSFAIPLPSHRLHYENVSIEFYYSDAEIKTYDTKERRLYMSSEFNETSGRHHNDRSISYGNRHKLKGITDKLKAKIIDSDVFDEHSRSLALSKSDFAENIYRDVPAFANFDFSHFSDIFIVVKSVLEAAESPPLQDESETIPIRFLPDKERIFRDSPPVVSIFVGRNMEIDRLLNPLIRVAAITGLGGEGKSTLAAKFYEMAVSGRTKVPFAHFGWCDCKDLETPFHQKLLTLLEELTEGEESKAKYAEENVRNTVRRFAHVLNSKTCLVVFDNIDAFVEKETCCFTGHVKALFDFLTTSLSNSLVIFTCRPQINDYHFSFLEVPVGGLSYTESLELAQNFGILGTRIEENDLRDLHAETRGHALWLNLIFAQLRNQRLTAASLDGMIGTESGTLDRHLLRSIWGNLSSNEKEMIWTIATFTRPPDIDKIERVSNMTYQKCSRMIRSLIRLRMIIEINASGAILYDLHPIIRIKAKEECKPQKKRSLFEKVIIILSFGNWNRLESIIVNNAYYTTEIDRYVECAEIALENSEFEKALDYINKVSEALLKYGEDAKFVELAIGLLQITNYDSYQIGIHPTLSSIYEDLINVFLEQGEYDKVESYLSGLDRNSQTIQQYIFYSRLMQYALWFKNEFVQAIELFEVAKRRITEKGEMVPSTMEYNYALALRDGGRVDEALVYFLSDTDLATINSWDPESGPDLAVEVGNISRCHYLNDQLEESLRLCRKSVQSLKKGHTRKDRVNYGYGLLWIADIYVKQGNFIEAKGYLDEAVEIWKKFCPSRLDKIRQHVAHYPQGVLKILSE
ncbi:MAG: hypothetical protein WB930_17850 [Syntrophobacteraceae bacterium]